LDSTELVAQLRFEKNKREREREREREMKDVKKQKDRT